MESIKNFLQTFAKSWEERNNESVQRTLDDVSGFLVNLSKKDVERSLEILFDEQKGILKFINVALNEMQRFELDNMQSSLKHAFNTLQIIMKKFQQEYELYIQQTRDLCFDYTTSTCHYYTRKKACETLKILIELYPDHDLQLDKIIEHFNDCYLERYNRKDGTILYSILGTIAKYCPKTRNLTDSVNEIYAQLLKDFESQIKTVPDKQNEEIKIYLDCYNDMFENFIPYEENEAKKDSYLTKIFDLMSTLCNSEGYQKLTKNKALFFIKNNMKLLSPYIYKDFKKWHLLFNNEPENYDNIGALRAFYSIMASNLQNEFNEDTFMYFKNYFLSNLDNSSSSKFQLAVYGLGELAVVFSNHAPAEIYEVFQKIALRTLFFYTEENETDKNFDVMVEFLRALSQILCYLPNISLNHVNIVTELSIHFINKFPDFRAKYKDFAINTLKKTFININKLKKQYQREYFNSFFREGILKSCSHTLLIDVEIKQEIEGLQEKPTSYKEYLSLWKILLKVNGGEISRSLVLQMLDEFLLVLITFIDKLNLNLKYQENDFFSFTSFPLQAENETDFHFFINLVDLYVEVLDEIESDLLQNWIKKLITIFIKFSYEHPLISGFYKFIEIIFKKPDVSSDCETYFSKSTCELINQYLSDVLKHISGFSGELQLSCIYLIFSTPPYFIKNLTNEIISVLKIAFNIGLTDLSLAFCALDALENWIRNLDFQYSTNFFKDILYCLEPYLSSEESLVDLFYGVEKRKRYVLNITTPNNDETLEDFQNRVLLFYGSLKSDILFDYVHEKSIDTNASWTKKNLLDYYLHFPDIRLKIQFDKFIPRIIELTKSGDRKIKISACEVLHTLITVIIGKEKMDECFNKKLCIAILNLGCDSDDAVKNLYHPFIIQLTHYLSSKLMKQSKVPQDFVDCLFEGLTQEFNPSMRDYCGLYLKEFVDWSIRQSIDYNSENVETIVRRINNFATFPSNKKRLAAAIAFNNLYTILRENPEIVNKYWLEFLYAFVKSLEEFSDIQIINAINHVEKVLKIKSNIFIAKSPDRRKPPVFLDETLKGTLTWLFSQCGSIVTKCRQKCMELFGNLVSLISEEEFFKDFPVNKINEIALMNLEDNIELNQMNRFKLQIKIFLKSLDFYIWILDKKFSLIGISAILKNLIDENNMFFKFLNNFVCTMIKQNIKKIICISTNSLVETQEIIDCTNEIIIKILEFLSKLDNLSNIAWNDNLFLFISQCIMCPSHLELSAKKYQISETLPNNLKNLLLMMKNNLSVTELSQFQKILSSKVNDNLKHFAEIDNIINQEEDLNTLEEFMEGLLILKKCDILNFEKEFNMTSSYLEEKFDMIFKSMKTQVMNNDTCRKLDEHVVDYLKKLMKFFLENCQAEIIEILIKFILENAELIALNGSVISHGEYFFEVFKEPIVNCMVEKSKKTMQLLDRYLLTVPDKVFHLTEELVIFAQRKEVANSEILADEVIARCASLSRQVNGIESRRVALFNINRKIILLKKQPTDAVRSNGALNDFYHWIFQELLDARDLDEKSLLLQNFIVCLTSEESRERDYNLYSVLHQLRDDHSEDYSRRLANDELLKFQAFSCFKVLIKSLILTRSIAVYEAIIKYAAGIYEHLSSEDLRTYLSSYYNNISEQNALHSLELTYQAFMNLKSSAGRLDILKRFLIPSMDVCRSRTVESFYARNSGQLLRCVREDPGQAELSPVDRKMLIVSQTGCYGLFEVAFAKFEVAFNGPADPQAGLDKPLNQLLVARMMELRSFGPRTPDEKEITRMLHCAALNCCASLLSLKREEKFYRWIFYEQRDAKDRSKDRLLWERIVDLEKQYGSGRSAAGLRKERKRLVNIRKQSSPNELDSKFRLSSFELSSLTLLENVHMYDLNDARVLAQANSTTLEPERRMELSFEDDELNAHECMATLTSTIVHLYNSGILNLPEDSIATETPGFLLQLGKALAETMHDNVRLFLIRLLCNVKVVTLRYMAGLFEALISALAEYLKKNPLNYVIRDGLVLLFESKYEPQSERDKDKANTLIRNLINRLLDPSGHVYKYNLEIFKSLCELWKKQIEYPNKFDEIVETQADLAINVVVILLRSGVEFDLKSKPNVVQLIRTSVANFNESESKVILRFEAMGWLLRVLDDEACLSETSRLQDLLRKLERANRERCVKCVQALHRGCPMEARCREFFKFVRPQALKDEHKARCLELFLHRLPELDSLLLPVELTLLELRTILQERVVGCEEAALKLVGALVPRLDESELRPYLELVVAGYTRPGQCLLEHRRLAYNALAEAYARFPRPHAVGELCCRALIRALAEPAEEVQQLALEFWRERVSLPETCCERLAALLELYEPEVGEGFVGFLCAMMLELTSKSPEDKQLMFQPLVPCEYKEYEVLVPRRRRNLGAVAPLFAPSLASQISRMSFMSGHGSFEASMRLLATKNLSFEPTAKYGVIMDVQPQTRQLPEPSQNVLSRRLRSELSQLQADYAEAAQRHRERRAEQLHREAESRRSGARLCRRYRLGDFPDLQITHRNLVEALSGFVARDRRACASFAVMLTSNLLEHARIGAEKKYQSLRESVVATLERLLREDGQSNGLVPVLLEVVLRAGDVKVNGNAVARICKSMNLSALGILLFEQESTYTETERVETDEGPPNRRVKLNPLNSRSWLHLASLYKSMGLDDVVRSIFEQTDVFPAQLREATLAQLTGNWSQAKRAFESALSSSASDNTEREHCEAGLAESLRELSSWKELNKLTRRALSAEAPADDYSAVWTTRGRRLLPWLMEGQLQAALADFTAAEEPDCGQFLATLNDWLAEHEVELKRAHGEELAVFLLCAAEDKPETKARHALKCAVDGAREQWLSSSPLSESLRRGLLLKLGAAFNIHAYMEACRAQDLEDGTRQLLAYWERHSPELGDELLAWNKLVYYRLSFAQRLHEKFQSESEELSILDDIIQASVKQRLKISELAIHNKNLPVTKKHLSIFNKIMEDMSPELRYNFELTAAKYKVLSGDVAESVKKKVEYYVSSWEITCNLLTNPSLDSSTTIFAKRHLFNLTSDLVKLVKKNPAVQNLLFANEFVLKTLNGSWPQEIPQALENYGLESLKSACEVENAKYSGSSFALLGKHCYELIQSSAESKPSLQNSFVSAILSGMCHGSSEAGRYFPCLLKPEYYSSSPETERLFVLKCADVPSWLFLPWQAQLLSYLSGPLAEILVPLLERLSRDYPNALRYSFRVSWEASPELRSRPTVRHVYRTLFADSRIEKLLEALHYVCQPEHFLRHHLERLLDDAASADGRFEPEAVDGLLAKVYGPLRGRDYVRLDKYRTDLEKLKDPLEPAEARAQLARRLLRTVELEASERLKKGRPSTRLRDYSPHLGDFCSGEELELEVPGQYENVNGKPSPRHHVRLGRFDDSVRVMRSARCPVRLRLIGNDARARDFLAKLGEDLRQDARLQQFFRAANECLAAELRRGRRKYLAVNTYHVLPLSSSMGLIEWVAGARSLLEFVQYSMAEPGLIEARRAQFLQWIQRAGSEPRNLAKCYEEALRKYGPREVAAKMRELEGGIEPDCLKRSFMGLSPSLECFLALRQNFVTSYAAMCLLHWLTGVGDRHLENSLVEVRSGQCYGIDFGLAFGTALDQSVPELVPFRLTRQILALLEPLDETGLFGITMSHVLAALRNERQAAVLLACLDVFVHEPLLDWLRRADRNLRADAEQRIDKTDLKWLPKMKIDIVKKKLNGINPSEIMLEELSLHHERCKYEDIIIPPSSTRWKLKEGFLTPEQQVQCLLEQAKDLNLLGRMWIGWTPFV